MTRGNHENRGAYAQHWLDYFPTPTGETYYTFRRGPAFFIVLDGCEDKPDNDPRYYGMGDWNEYRRQQAEWLKGVVNSDEFRAAPVRIVLMHMIPGKEDSWYGEQQIRRLFVPELAGKGIDLMLCGHYHRYHWIDDGSRGSTSDPRQLEQRLPPRVGRREGHRPEGGQHRGRRDQTTPHRQKEQITTWKTNPFTSTAPSGSTPN